jgi:hypothetical protein
MAFALCPCGVSRPMAATPNQALYDTVPHRVSAFHRFGASAFGDPFRSGAQFAFLASQAGNTGLRVFGTPW